MMMASLSGNLATMGCGMPYAIGAKFAFPTRPVIALVGDGAMQMNGNAEYADSLGLNSKPSRAGSAWNRCVLQPSARTDRQRRFAMREDALCQTREWRRARLREEWSPARALLTRLGMNRPLLSVVLALGLSGCAAKSHNTVESTGVTRPTPPAPRAEADTRSNADDASQALAALMASPIYFSLDSSQLTSQYQDELERLALALRQRPLARLTVAGHTCELGTTEYNLALGKQRADMVRTYLVRLGVEPQRISVVSFGEERPADEHTPDKNRRAEFSFRLAEQARAGEL